MAIDYTTDIGRVRLLITDTDEASPIFSDAQIEAFLDIEGDVLKLGAARALETIAVNEALVQKRIKLLDLSTDGPAVAKALQDAAKHLREEVAKEDADAEQEFDWSP